MYRMMTKRNEIEEFETIQSCISAMVDNGYKCRIISFVEGETIFTKKILIDQNGNVKIGRKKAEKAL